MQFSPTLPQTPRFCSRIIVLVQWKCSVLTFSKHYVRFGGRYNVCGFSFHCSKNCAKSPDVMKLFHSMHLEHGVVSMQAKRQGGDGDANAISPINTLNAVQFISLVQNLVEGSTDIRC